MEPQIYKWQTAGHYIKGFNNVKIIKVSLVTKT